MTDDLDHYEVYYADKLWSLLPAVYRAEDADQFVTPNGPLREIVNRIGAQAAVLRRSIDRLWEDQSIETCDDWVIPYLGDLLATNLTAKLDAQGQRRDVAKTIYYRRRKGTLAILEEIAADLTGWEAKTVEFFRRLGRTRHGLDPAIGMALSADDGVATLQWAEGLVGSLTRTGSGGLADLRNVSGASNAYSAFDEFFHTADFRRGQGQVGWHNIPRLGVFLWRLKSFAAGPTTPVAFAGFPDCFTFDATGRDVPLFAQSTRTSEAYGSGWVSPLEAQLPTPISPALLTGGGLYPASLAVLGTPAPTGDADVLPPESLKFVPGQGRFKLLGPSPGEVRVRYHYGFSSEIGAGSYDRRQGRNTPAAPDPILPNILGGGTPAALPSSGTWTLGDSLTYTAPAASDPVEGVLTLRALNGQRPLIRLPAAAPGTAFEWHLAGSPGSSLVLDGLFFSGGDLVLSGNFDTVTITCCTLDPGGVGSPPVQFALAADGRALLPTRLWIEGSVGTLQIERSITGPILTRTGGSIGSVALTDSIVQAIPHSTPDIIVSPPSTTGALETALLLSDGELSLSRCTVMGQILAHRLEASECILRGQATVDDTQQGGVRFTAWTDGSILPRKYESVRIAANAPLFTSLDFGQPGYGQLLPTVDAAIVPVADALAAQNTISAGAVDGSEMGAFAREANPLKERSLLLKYQEFMPAGLVPVIIHVT